MFLTQPRAVIAAAILYPATGLCQALDSHCFHCHSPSGLTLSSPFYRWGSESSVTCQFVTGWIRFKPRCVWVSFYSALSLPQKVALTCLRTLILGEHLG